MIKTQSFINSDSVLESPLSSAGASTVASGTGWVTIAQLTVPESVKYLAECFLVGISNDGEHLVRSHKSTAFVTTDTTSEVVSVQIASAGTTGVQLLGLSSNLLELQVYKTGVTMTAIGEIVLKRLR